MANVVKYVLTLEDKASPALRRTAKEADHYADELGDVDKSQRKASTSAESLSDQTTKAGASMGQAGVSAANVAKGLTAVATVAVGAAVGVAKLQQNTADLRNDLLDAGTRSGFAADKLAGLKLAAEGSGQQFSALLPGLDQFGAKMASAATGTGKQAAAFAALGVAVTGADGDLRDGNEVLEETLAALNAMPPSAKRSAIAVDALGRSGGKLLQALSGTELSGFVEMANEFGVKVGPKAAEAAGQWQRDMAELNLVFEGLQARLSDAIGGTFSLQGFTDALVVAGEFVSVFVGDAGARFTAFGRAVAGIFELIEDTIRRTGGAFTDFTQGNFGAALAKIGDNQRDLVSTVTDLGSAIAGLAVGGFDSLDRAAAAAEARLARLDELRRKISPQQASGDISGGTTSGGTAAGSAGGGAAGALEESALVIPVVTDQVTGLNNVLGELSRAFAESGENADRLTRAARALAALDVTSLAVGAAGQAARGDVGGMVSAIGEAAGSAGAAQVGGILSTVGGIGAAGIARQEQARAALQQARASGDKEAIQAARADLARGPGQAAGEAVGERLEGFFSQLLAGVQAIPTIIAQVVPNLVASIGTKIIPGLLKAVPRIIKSIVIDLPINLVKTLPKAIFGVLRGLFVQLPKAIGRQFGNALKQLPKRIADALKEVLRLGDGKDSDGDGKSNTREAIRDTVVEAVTFGIAETETYNKKTGRSNRRTATPEEAVAASFALSAPVRGRLDVSRRPVSAVESAQQNLQNGNPFRSFADQYDVNAGSFGTLPGRTQLRSP